jgi:protoporphyrinogen oxidase
LARLAVIGAGVMGLAAAYHAQKRGHDVTIYETDDIVGGMAAHFDFGGISIERFYHFICKADQDTFDLLSEIGLGDALRWRITRMGYYIDGKVYPWGDPLSLLSFPKLSPLQKLRFGLMAFLSTKRKNWRRLDDISAVEWVRAWVGEKAYDLLWRRLFELKFHEFTDKVSAAWIWTRIKRIGNSRRSIFREELGYIEGGSERLVNQLAEIITQRGGKIRLATPVMEVTAENGHVTGIRTRNDLEEADYVISTVPTPYVSQMVPTLSANTKRAYGAIENIGVVCVILKVSKPVTRNFWLNIVDENIAVPGIVEFSNLRPMSETIVYVPYYMPASHKKFSMSDAAFAEEAFGNLRKINPELQAGDLVDCKIGRLRHAQPVCGTRFLSTHPPVVTEIEGLQIADTCFYYPEDRGISESVRLGKEMAERLPLA